MQKSAPLTFKRKLQFTFLYLIFIGALVLTSLEIFCAYLIYKKGAFLKECDPRVYSQLQADDPLYQFSKPVYQTDIRYGWKHTPNNQGVYRGFSYPKAEFRIPVEINANGYRSPKDYQLNPGKKLIAVMGDSFVQAFQVKEDEMLTKVLENDLQAKNKSIEVYNFGVSSIGTIHQYRQMIHEIFPFKPSMIVLCFFTNDITNNSHYLRQEKPGLIPHYRRNSDGSFEILDFTHKEQEYSLKFQLKDRKFKNSELYQKVYSGLSATQKTLPFLNSLKYFRELAKVRFGLERKFDSNFAVYHRQYIPLLQESFELTVWLIEEMYRMCYQKDIDFLVVLLPAKEQVIDQEWKKYINFHRIVLDENHFDTQRPTNELGGILDSKNIPVYNLLPVFRNHPRKEDLYYQQDHHFSPKGQAMAASEISNEIQRRFF